MNSKEKKQKKRKQSAPEIASPRSKRGPELPLKDLVEKSFAHSLRQVHILPKRMLELDDAGS